MIFFLAVSSWASLHRRQTQLLTGGYPPAHSHQSTTCRIQGRGERSIHVATARHLMAPAPVPSGSGMTTRAVLNHVQYRTCRHRRTRGASATSLCGSRPRRPHDAHAWHEHGMKRGAPPAAWPSSAAQLHHVQRRQAAARAADALGQQLAGCASTTLSTPHGVSRSGPTGHTWATLARLLHATTMSD